MTDYQHWPHKPPTLPFQKGSETSREAAESMKPHAGSVRQRVYDMLLELGEDGATDDEIQAALGGMNASTARPRRVELVQMGAAYKTDRKRKTRAGRNACVYCAIPDVDITRKPGRPPRPPSTALAHKLTVYLTEGQKRKMERMARQDARSTAEVARQCMGIGWQQLADSRRFFEHGEQWTEDKE